MDDNQQAMASSSQSNELGTAAAKLFDSIQRGNHTTTSLFESLFGKRNGEEPLVDEGISVKEALTKGFTNYKARLPKRPSDEPDTKKMRISTLDMEPGTSHTNGRYELPPFWKIEVEVNQWGMGGHSINDVKYLPFNGLIHGNSLIVPYREGIPFTIKGKNVSLSLRELLKHNGIFLNDHRQMKDLFEVFSISGLLIHYRIFEYLLNEGRSNVQRIVLSEQHPPFANLRPKYWKQFMGAVQGANHIIGCRLSGESSEPRELSPHDQLLLIIQASMNTPLSTIARTFDITEQAASAILENQQNVRSSSALILINKYFESAKKVPKETGQPKAKLRRTSYVVLNLLIWRLFKSCADQGIAINGKILRDFGMLLSLQLGSGSFKASEGWLDSFKKRHRIDMKAMTGVPCSEEDEADARAELIAIRYQLTKEQEQVEVYREEEERMQEIRQLEVKEEPAESVSPSSMETDREMEPTPPADVLTWLFKSASIQIPNAQVSYAIDTLRVFLLAHDPMTLPQLVDLQQKLAQTARSLINVSSTSQ